MKFQKVFYDVSQTYALESWIIFKKKEKQRQENEKTLPEYQGILIFSAIL